MDERTLNTTFGRAGTAVAQNRVLRNTYMLLALSMIPTVVGALVGITFNIPIPRGFMGAILFLAVAFGFIWAIEKNKNSTAGVPILLAFTFFMGLMLSRLLISMLALKNGGQLIALAAGGTGLIFAGMSVLAATIKKDLSFMGKFLFVGAIMLLVAMLANFFIQSSALAIGITVLVLGVFSLYLLYDLQQIVRGGETNYISATLSVYLDLFNIFQSLLSLLGIGFGDRD